MRELRRCLWQCAGGGLLLVWLCGAAWGQSIRRTQRGGDFNPASTAWNGLSAFVSEAERLGLRVETPRRWNWRQARINVPIVIIAPRDEELTTAPLKQFVAAGGRVLLADDFGTGDGLWGAFGLEGYRLSVPPKTWKKQRYVDVHRTLPHPQQEADFLLRQASYLFLNVPQWLLVKRRGVAEPLLLSVPYRSNRPDRGMGGKVLWRVSHGRGKMVVFSDPSAFINQMVAYGDNHRFVRNVFQYLALPTRARKIILLWGGAEWEGKTRLDAPRGALLSIWWWDAMTHFNSVLTPLPALYAAWPPLWRPQGTAHRATPSPSASWALTQIRLHRQYLGNRILLLSLLLICLGGVWIRFAPMWSQHAHGERGLYEDGLLDIPSRFDEQIESYREGALSYLGPLIMLKEELVTFLMERLSIPLPKQGQEQEQVAANKGIYMLDKLEELRKAGKLPAGIVRVMPQLQRLLLQIPGRHQWGSPEQRAVDAKALKMYYNTAMLCLRSMGMEDEFQRSRWQSRPTKAVDRSVS